MGRGAGFRLGGVGVCPQRPLGWLVQTAAARPPALRREQPALLCSAGGPKARPGLCGAGAGAAAAVGRLPGEPLADVLVEQKARTVCSRSKATSRRPWRQSSACSSRSSFPPCHTEAGRGHPRVERRSVQAAVTCAEQVGFGARGSGVLPSCVRWASWTALSAPARPPAGWPACHRRSGPPMPCRAGARPVGDREPAALGP